MTELPPPAALPVSSVAGLPSSAAAPTASSPTRAPVASAPVQHATLGTLRGVVTLLVLAHHALLAYHPYAPPAGPALTAMPFWRAFPVVDAERWSAATWITGWNDTFFMALMFLLAGLFVWPSLRRKGAAAYARDRLLRLGLPFAVFALALAPLAYAPSYLQSAAVAHSDASWSGFWAQWTALAPWPTGPAWFLSLLLVFDAVALALYGARRAVSGTPVANAASATSATSAPSAPGALGRAAAFVRRTPAAFFVGLLALAVVTYLPMAERYGTMRWTSVGPLTFQTSRVLLYAAFFFAGVALGARGLLGTALVPGGALARRFWLWIALGALAFWASTQAAIAAFAKMGLSAAANRLAALAFAAACVSISVAMLALALRLGRARARAEEACLDGIHARLTASLRRCAYGMFLLHYPISSWLQYRLLDVGWSGPAKACVAVAGTVALSWLGAAALCRVPLVRRVV